MFYVLLFQIAISQTIQERIDGSVLGGARKGGTVVLPRGEYLVSDTIRLKTIDSLRLVGEGKAATVIKWTGLSNKPVFLVDDCQHCEFHDFGIQFATPARCAFEMTNGVNDPSMSCQYIPTQNKLFNIRIGDNRPMLDLCVDMWNRTEDDNNNDLHEFHRVEFTGYKQTAVRMSGGQIHGIYFDHCSLHGRDEAPYGVRCDYGAFFTWFGGTGGHHSQFDFQLVNFLNKVVIDDWNSEGSQGLIENLSSKWEGPPLVIKNCRFDGYSNKNYVIAGRNLGTLNVESCTFQPISGRPRIYYAPLGGTNAGQLTVTKCEITTRGVAPYTKIDPFIVADRNLYTVKYEGNFFRDLITGNVSVGDQEETRGGVIVANKQQSGIVTTDRQTFIGDKTFASINNDNASLTIQSTAPDGRMSIASARGSGLTFYHNNNIAEFYPTNLDLRLPNNITIYNGAGFGCTQPAYAGGSKQIKISSNGEWMDIYSMAYATDGYPGIRFSSPKYQWNVSPGAWPAQGGAGVTMLSLDGNGLKIGSVLFTPTADGDILLNSAKFNNVLLSSFRN